MGQFTPLRESKLPIVWVLGGPGSGKGTQCSLIVAKYGYIHLSIGELLRAEVKSGSERGKELKAYMEKGELVPNANVLDLLKEAMQSNGFSSNGFLIDGNPERETFLCFEKEGLTITYCLYFNASEDTLTKRLLGRANSSGRADDNAENIKRRLETFSKVKDVALNLYPEKFKLINAELSVDEVFGEVQTAMDAILI